MELVGDPPEDPPLEQLRDAEYHDMQDKKDGTGRWNKKGTPHDKRWWHTKAHRLDSRTFSAMFRLRKTTFRSLVFELYGTTDLFRVENRGPYIDPCERVALFLFRLGGANGVRQTAAKFDLSEGKVVSWILSVAKLAKKRILKRYVRWPIPEEQRQIMEEWEEDDALRKVIGGIDGSHIRLLNSDDEDLPAAYRNFKNYNSIVLLGIVDNHGRFRWHCSGCPGSCRDMGVLKVTAIYSAAEAERSKPEEDRDVFSGGSCILGDTAFLEGPWMRTPITRPKKRSERYFNHKHAEMRVRVEHAFGRLKSVFQALQYGLDVKLEDAPTIIDACVGLYTFILQKEGDRSGRVFIDDAQTVNGTGRARGRETSKEREAEVAYLRTAGFLREEWGRSEPQASSR